MNLYSIIIPHRNIPALLRRCLKSIPKREDTEIIVIDDCSDEFYAGEIDAIEKEFPYVIMLHNNSNMGPGRCRNIGIATAKGEKVIFADADDYFNYCFDEILNEYKEDLHDVVYFNASSSDSVTYVNVGRMQDYYEMVKGYESNADKAIFCLKYVNGGPCCKIIKKSLIEKNHILFEDYIVHEDTKFSYMIGYYAQSVTVDQRAIYCVTYRPNSLSTIIDEERLLIKVKVFLQKEAFLKAHNLSTNECKLHYYGLIEAYMSGNNAIYEKVVELFEEYGYSRAEIESYIQDYNKSKNRSKNRLIIASAINKCLRLFR